MLYLPEGFTIYFFSASQRKEIKNTILCEPITAIVRLRRTQARQTGLRLCGEKIKKELQ